MDPDEAKFMRTDRRPGTIDVHPRLNAIILNYEVEVTVISTDEVELHSEKRNLKKIIELPSLNSRTDCLALAKEVVNQCDLIHYSRLAEVEQTIFYLKKRKLSQGAPRSENKDEKNKRNAPLVDDTVKYSSLMDYIELLYEGMPEKVRGAHQIQLLARDPANLGALSKNETLISAIGRVLREDWKRSIVLSTHLVYTFFCFSMYPVFHEVILKCKVGSICMDIIDHELKRFEELTSELRCSDSAIESQALRKTCPTSSSMSEIHRSRIPEPVRPRSGNFSDANYKSIMEGSIYEDLTTSIESISDKKLTDSERKKRYRTLIKKQDNLLRICFYLLLNIAEDVNVEEKMSKRNIVGLLTTALNKQDEELLMIVVTFLKKLSIMNTNKDAMINLNIIEKIIKFLDSQKPELVLIILQTLFNLSFDKELREKMMDANILPKLVTSLSDERFQEYSLKLLYHLSYEEESKPKFIDSVELIMDMLLLNSGNEDDEVMVALCVNLAVDNLNAQKMITKNRLYAFLTRAFMFQNVNMMKAIHNISEHKENRIAFIEYVGDIAKAVKHARENAFVRECLGILSNLVLPELDWAEIFKHFSLIEWVETNLMSKNNDVQMILEIIVFLGTAALDDGCSKLYCRSKILNYLIELLKAHQEDDEIVLQILFVFYRILSHKKTVDYLIASTEVPAYFIDLLQDNNTAIREICYTCLTMISDRNTSWADRIKIEKFRQHNAQWLQMVDSHELDGEVQGEDDNELPPYLNAECLMKATISPLSDINHSIIEDLDHMDLKENDPEKEMEEYLNQPLLIQDFEIESM